MYRPEHPNPQFMRKNWQNLNGEWDFEIDYGNSGNERGMYSKNAEFATKINVPFCPQSELSGIGIKDFMSSVWYKRVFNISEEQLSGRVLLHFGAVDFEATVWVNGENVGKHYGGYSSFSFDITSKLKVGENIVTLNAKDDVRSGNQPIGKQSVEYAPRFAWYTRTIGIWQTVWLEFVPETYIKSFKYYPNIVETAFDIDINLSSKGIVTVEAFYEDRLVGIKEQETLGNNLKINIPLKEKHLWGVGEGNLYQIKITLKTNDSCDEVLSYAGLREVTVDGFKVLINGKSVFQRTVLDQGFYPDGIYTAPNEEALIRDIDLSLELGFNGARLHEKIFEPRFLYHCDRKGYLVWGEHANWGLMSDRESALQNFLPEWIEAVERDFNHPSIIGWCPLNEIWDQYGGDTDTGRRFIKSVYDITKAIDRTRPVIDVSGGFHICGDIFDQHDYDQNPESFRAKYTGFDGKLGSIHFEFENKQKFLTDKPFYMSEYGGIKWVPDFKKDSENEKDWGYGDAPKTEEEFFARYEGLTESLLEAPNIMGFCYTQLYDVEQEVNGLYTYEREKKFDDYSRIIVANTKKATIEKQ